MGIYDDIKCDYPLPDTEIQRETFQTKCLLERRFSDCLITQNGKLMLDNIDVQFHGIIEFYTFYKEDFYEYSAKFTDGKIVMIKRI